MAGTTCRPGAADVTTIITVTIPTQVPTQALPHLVLGLTPILTRIPVLQDPIRDRMAPLLRLLPVSGEGLGVREDVAVRPSILGDGVDPGDTV